MGSCYYDSLPTPDAREAGGSPATEPYDFCPVTVTDDLNDLRGPTRGRHRLPRDLEPGAGAHYDLGDRWARRRLTITVLTAAATAEELHTWIDRDTLLAAWPTLYLDADTRDAWEARQPTLRTRRRPPTGTARPDGAEPPPETAPRCPDR